MADQLTNKDIYI